MPCFEVGLVVQGRGLPSQLVCIEGQSSKRLESNLGLKVRTLSALALVYKFRILLSI